MAIDQTKLGQHISEQMAAIEADPDVSENAQIGDIVTIVEILDPGPGEFVEGQDVQLSRALRRRSTGLPQSAIGLMSEALFRLLKENT